MGFKSLKGETPTFFRISGFHTKYDYSSISRLPIYEQIAIFIIEMNKLPMYRTLYLKEYNCSDVIIMMRRRFIIAHIRDNANHNFHFLCVITC
jgi:hypothetical protein